MKPKVVLLGPHPTRRGGIAAVIALYLAAWDNDEADMRFVATVAGGSRRQQLQTYAGAVIRFIGLLVRWRPDVAHIHFSWRGSFVRKAALALLARLARVRVVLHCHSGRFDQFYHDGGRVRRALIRWVLDSADSLVVVSEPWQAFFEGLGLRVPITVVPNAVLCPPAQARPSTYSPVVLTLGRLEAAKGVYDTLQAAPRVLARHPTVRFGLGGDGELAQVQRQLDAAPWGDHVHLLGWVDGPAKTEAFRQATLFVLPSYSEGLPMSILEAMSYGLPVVSTPVGGIPTVVIEGETGFCVPPGDAAAIADRINRLLDDPELCARLGANARQLIATHFEIHQVLRQVYALYARLPAPTGARA